MAMPGPLLHVLLDTGSKVEAVAARRALAKSGRQLVMGTGSMHTTGQALNGDAVVVGRGPSAIDQDVTGRVWRVASVADLSRLDLSSAGASAPAAVQEKTDEPGSPPPFDEVPLVAGSAMPDVDAMTRVQLIQHAAEQWPGQRRWATMSDVTLRAAVRELSEGVDD